MQRERRHRRRTAIERRERLTLLAVPLCVRPRHPSCVSPLPSRWWSWWSSRIFTPWSSPINVEPTRVPVAHVELHPRHSGVDGAPSMHNVSSAIPRVQRMASSVE